jgi:hypothetical protein
MVGATESARTERPHNNYLIAPKTRTSEQKKKKKTASSLHLLHHDFLLSLKTKMSITCELFFSSVLKVKGATTTTKKSSTEERSKKQLTGY